MDAKAVEPVLHPGGEEVWLDNGNRIELKEAEAPGKEEAVEEKRELEEWQAQVEKNPMLFQNIVSVKRLEAGRCLDFALRGLGFKPLSRARPRDRP